jgi:RimJ/RimL family protein N-acetyltransferase
VAVVNADDHELLRPMTPADVDAVLDVQEPGAILGLASVFPQDAFPFPRDSVGERWQREIADPTVYCYVVSLGDAVAGFAATKHDEFLHFGIAPEHWGSGLATQAHNAVVDRLARQGFSRGWLTVFTDNRRGRRFYEKLGWEPTGQRTRSSFPPYPELLRYDRQIGPPQG